MQLDEQRFTVRVLRAGDAGADLRAAQRLRYRVFVAELGAGGAGVDHEAQLETDAFDPVCDHLLLIDRTAPAPDHVAGVYRLMRGDQAEAFGRFYCDDEYDLSPLRSSGRRLLELGRSCVAPELRGSSALFLLWNALGLYAIEHGSELLFGVASFHGTDPAALAQPLSLLAARHAAPQGLRPRSRVWQDMALLPEAEIRAAEAMRQMPPLIKAYLRLGGTVGDGAFVDHAFNTTDVLLVMDTATMSARHRAFYQGRAGE